MEQELEPERELEQPQGRRGARVHLVALPHTQLTKAYDWCAYTAKLRRFTHMLTAAGHTPIVYGPQERDVAAGTEYVPIVSAEDRQRWFGAPEWDTSKVFDAWDASAVHWMDMNRRAAVEISQRWQPDDIIGLIGGLCQQQVISFLRSNDLMKPLVWEWGIGYSGVLDDSHKTFESHAWAHHVAGLRHKDDIAFFDSVVPNCFDPTDFTPNVHDAGEYLLYLGRPTARKGLPILSEIASRTKLPIVVAGQPGADIHGAEHVGVVTGQRKAELLAGARALIAPTMYLEPFGGIVVEAALSGTPAITTDWGAFTETVIDGVTGLRCRTLFDFLDAIDSIGDIDRADVLRHAQRYTLDRGAQMYDRVITRLLTLRGAGWYALPARYKG